MPAETAEIAVVIAYYQRQSGLLLRAVRSALSQSAGPLHIIVVDDGSPLPAADELSLLAEGGVKIIRQPNAGPGAARNRGLADLPEHIRFVAFLDSDDEWAPDHIARALAALGRGADFYFTDYVPLDGAQSTFALCGLDPGDHAAEGDGFYSYGQDLFDALLRRAPVGTSTVVFRRELLGVHRFPETFSYGEDVFFWMLLTSGGCRTMFSVRPGAIYGRGVNIAAGAGWGTPSSLRRLSSEFRLHQTIARRFPLDAIQSRWSKAWRKEVSRSFLTSLLHLLRHRKAVDWATVKCFFEIRA